jgi:hypothetical protein
MSPAGADGRIDMTGVDMYWRSVGAGGTPLVVVPSRTRYGVFQAPELAGLVASFLA